MRIEEMHFIEIEAEYHLDASKGVNMLRDFMHDYRDAAYNRIQVGADFKAFKKVETLKSFNGVVHMSLCCCECDILCVASADRLKDDVYVDIFCGKLAEDFISNTGNVGNADD